MNECQHEYRVLPRSTDFQYRENGRDVHGTCYQFFCVRCLDVQTKDIVAWKEWLPGDAEPKQVAR